MKKVISIIVVVLLFISTASAEVSFQKIPWLSNDETVVKALIDAGFLRGNPELDLTNEKAVFLTKNEDLDYQPTYLAEYKDYSFTATLSDNVKGKIAGYPVKNIIPTFAYDGEYRLIAIIVELINADYTSLKENSQKSMANVK